MIYHNPLFFRMEIKMNYKNLVKSKQYLNIFKYSLVKYIVLIIGFVKGIVNANVLGTDLFGLLGNLVLIMSYLTYTNLGILYSMNSEYIIAKERKLELEPDKILKSSFGTLILISIVMLSVSSILYVLYKDIKYSNYYFMIVLIAIFEQFRLYFINFFRLNNNISTINKIDLVNNVFTFILIIILIKQYSLYGVLISMLLSGFFVFVYGIKKSKINTIEIDYFVQKKLIIIGIPLLLYNLGFFVLNTIDRLFIIKFLSFHDLGIYTFSLQLVAGVTLLLSSILFLYYPSTIKEMNTLSNNQSSSSILNKIIINTRRIELLGVSLFLIGFIFVEIFIQIFAYDYKESIKLFNILILSNLFIQLSFFSNVYLISNGKQNKLITLQILTIIFSLIVNSLVVYFKFDILVFAVFNWSTMLFYTIIQHMFLFKILKVPYYTFLNIFKKYIVFSLLSITIIFYVEYKVSVILILFISIVLYWKDFLQLKNHLR